MRKNGNIILPNFITLLGLLAGTYSIVASMEGRYSAAAVAIILAAVFDGLDGKVARLVNGTSEFGVQLDSLADVISFGVAPAVLMYKWQLLPFGRIGIMVMFLFIACGALRLARFNVQTKKISSVFFVGMPIPGAAAIISSFVPFARELDLYNMIFLPYASIVLVIFLSFLMVSTVPYYSFKHFGFIKTRPFNMVVILVLFVVVIGIEPKVTIFGVLLLYVISGFIMMPVRKRLISKLDKDGAI